MAQNEAFSRVIIDALLADQGWNTQDTNSVRYEVVLGDGTRADYVLCDRHGRSLAVIEAKRFSVNPADATEQAKNYARQLNVPYVFLANGQEIRFWDWQREAYPHPVKTFFKQDDLERRAATAQVKREPLEVPIDSRIAGRDYQQACIDTLCKEMGQGRRKLLVEMATGTGKTRTAAALIKRLFEANAITRVLFLVDRIPLAKQTEDAFAEHLTDYPAYVLRTGRRFQDEKLITITTLQSMVNIYSDYSSGYFDLVISDECHRSIYGKWSGVLKHFDGVQIGLTATPCVANLEDMAPDEKGRALAPSPETSAGDAAFDAVLMRERLSGTGMNEGVAIPHARVRGLEHPVGGFARLETPQDFGALDGRPADLVFLLLAPAERGGDHLKALARVSRFLRRADVRDKLRHARSAVELKALFASTVRSDAA